MPFLRLIFDICLLRGKPQDLPASHTLLVLAALAGVVVDFLSLPNREFDFGRLLFIVTQAVLFGTGLWMLLKLRGFAARWTQTATALYAANALFSLLLLPLIPALAEMLEAGPPASLGWQGMLMMVLSGWFLAVMARVLREALEASLLGSFGLSLALIFAVRLAGFALAPLFGLKAGF